ncbi:hypothetical protein [Mycobacterium marinum]|uniref:hypothetical protein n=1 Tax=Mycobacterium marinum TaxID=1781 RepID=UPI0035674A05
MNEAEDETDTDPALTVELLADLQAGLLDDETAAQVRRRIRTDPQAAATLEALQRVRRDVAQAGTDTSGLGDPPPHLPTRITDAVRSATSGGPTAAHAARPRPNSNKILAGIAGLIALVATIGLGTAALITAPGPTPSGPPTAMHITVSTPPPVIPLSHDQVLDLLQRAPDYGPFADPSRRASCLSGLGYPASTPILGAQPVDINARPGVLLVLAGDAPADLAVYAVALNCSAADTGLLASTTLPRLPDS